MAWILKLLKGLLGGKASSLIGGLSGSQLAGVASALIGQGGSNLSALMQKFDSAGLSNLVQSWVGKGANEKVTGEQVKSVLGSDAVSEVGTRLGVSEDEAADKISGVLPELIDKLTPDGSVPDEQTLAAKLKALLK
jgi:uncharacterized protein YidB (DUF937 family)